MGKHFHPRPSPTPPSPTAATPPASTPKPPSTASTCCAPASTPTPSTPPRSSSYKNLANVERDFRIIKPTTSTCGRSTTASTTRQSPRADLPARLLPGLAPTQGLGTNDVHRRAPTPTGHPVAAAQRSPEADAKHPANTTPTATRCAASAACSTTWPPSPATRSATTAPAPRCPSRRPHPRQRRAFDLLSTPIPLTTA